MVSSPAWNEVNSVRKIHRKQRNHVLVTQSVEKSKPLKNRRSTGRTGRGLDRGTSLAKFIDRWERIARPCTPFTRSVTIFIVAAVKSFDFYQADVTLRVQAWLVNGCGGNGPGNGETERIYARARVYRPRSRNRTFSCVRLAPRPRVYTC